MARRSTAPTPRLPLWPGVALLAACSGEGSDGSPTPPEPSHTGNLVPTGTTGTGGSGTPPEDLPFSASLRMDERLGLVGWLDVSADAPVTLALDVSVDGRAWSLAVDTAAEVHQVPLFGLRPDADLVVDVTATDGSSLGARQATLRTPPLPDGLEVPVAEVPDPSRLEPGVTVVANDGKIFALDTDGVPCWWMPYAAFPVNEISVRDGLLTLNADRDHLETFDLLGQRTLRIGTELDPYRVQATDALALHHDHDRLPNGNFLALSVERRFLPYPTSETDETAPLADQWVAGDVVIELAPDGSVVREAHLLDLLEPSRIARDGVRGDFWFNFEPWRADETRDWSHSNSVSYHAPTDTVVVSMRHQDALAGIRWSTGELLWILGNPSYWPPELLPKLLFPGPAARDAGWFWHPHSGRIQADGSIVLFDNHNYGAPAWVRPPPEEEVEKSRGMVFSIDPAARTFELTWAWGEELNLYAPSYGDLDLLPTTGHRLLTYGNISRGSPASASILEVSEAGEILARYDLYGGGSWYRAVRVAGLFPGPGR